ncbi:MAG: hypothetical protein ABI451_00735 [Dokdonella sp.]
MHLESYAGVEEPSQDKRLLLKPRLVSWTSRLWRESPGRTIPLFKLEARVDPRDVDDRDLAEALRPFAGSLQKIAIYLLHTEEIKRHAAWAVGRFDIDAKGASMFFHDFLGAANGMLMLELMQTASTVTDLVMSVVPVRIEPANLCFAISDYDLGIHNRIG